MLFFSLARARRARALALSLFPILSLSLSRARLSTRTPIALEVCLPCTVLAICVTGLAGCDWAGWLLLSGMGVPPHSCAAATLCTPSSLASRSRRPAVPENLTMFVAGHRFAFIGNSVTRHYAFALRDMLDSGNDGMLDRKMEKAECRTAIGVATCELHRRNGWPSIHFWWKNYIGNEHELAWDDAQRDVCGLRPAGACLAALFAAHKFRRSDVLVVGSIPINVSHFRSIDGDSKAQLHICGPKFAEANAVANLTSIAMVLLKAFPGTILWHSYPALDMARHVGPRPFDINSCFARINDAISCALDTPMLRASARIRFVDLRPLQQPRVHQYADFIHHPGELSEHAVRMLVAEQAAARREFFTTLRASSGEHGPRDTQLPSSSFV